MGIKDQFQDKAQELADRAKQATGKGRDAKDEASQRATQGRESAQDAKERAERELRERTGRDS
ncbi:hypothetical protein ACFFSH_07345 [Streptomyces filamentosus]|uniref:Uncharacterized protein n=1 Tax=Streptomyces filamentosus TaxID=67294 RepID=A0A919BMN2_STRFL|nr:hypothetical protein [Streptomyces filamentosus]KAA6218092.1 hypothetical protein CP979_15065 [Streptomyces filamentosus]GHF97840.1 hypothetical protein GCM10017667_30420 [Streptomyces filamentosus]